MVSLKLVPSILKWFVIIAGILYLIISPLTSSVIQCAKGDGCINILRDTGGLLFNTQQNIKEFGIRIIEEAPKYPDVYDKVVVDLLKSNLIINLGIWILIVVGLFFLFMMILGKGDAMPKKLLMIFICILLALSIVGLLTILYNLIIFPHHFVNPYEGIMYLFKNFSQIFSKIGPTINFPINLTIG